MTGTEMLAIGGGLLLGYWIIGVFVPSLFDRDTAGDAQAEDTAVADAPDGEGDSPRWFDVLDVSPAATHDEIVAAWKLQISQYHPDKVARMGKEIRALAEAKSQAINAACDEGLRLRPGPSTRRAV